jgi:hypothetical protein
MLNKSKNHRMKPLLHAMPFRNTIALVAMFICTTCLLSAQDITTGLKLYYSFEDVVGDSVPDVSGNNQTAALKGAAAIKPAYSGLGVECLIKDNYLLLPVDILTNTTDFTFATWVYFNGVNGSTRFFDFGTIADNNSPDDFLCFMPNSGSGFARMRYRTTGGSIGLNVDATEKTPAAQWCHMAVTFDWDETLYEGLGAGTATIYLNGQPVGTAEYTTLPSMMGTGTSTTNYVARSRWEQDKNGLNAILDEIRLYTRALNATDMAALYGVSSEDLMIANGYPSTLINAQKQLAIAGDLTAVSAPLTLATSADGGVNIVWSSSNPAIVDSLGSITRPEQYDATVILTATLSQVVGEKTYYQSKRFTVVVTAFNQVGYQIAKWSFLPEKITLEEDGSLTVTDETESGFQASLKNEATIKTIGKTQQFNVLDLGNGTGYLDLGQDIGKAIYSLNNYTMCGFFRIAEDYAYLNSNGNFFWTFSNTADAMGDPTGYVIGSLKSQGQSIATHRYDKGNQGVNVNTNAPVGEWHHFAYTQIGNEGSIYVDGILQLSGTITNLPSLALPREGRTGTWYNWLGRSNYISDVYLRKTMLYDFQLWREGLTADDISYEMNIAETLEQLNNAYAEDSNYLLPELVTECDALILEGLTDVTSNLTLPTAGTLDNTIAISWHSDLPSVLTNQGVVARPEMYPATVKLTATLFKSGQSIKKTFDVTVKALEGTGFTQNMLVKFDFSSVIDTLVTDVAEKHFVGTLKNNAAIRSIGETTLYPTLDMYDSTAYFDMGKEMGRILYNLNDYTMSCFYRVDESHTALSKDGNFMWTFANSDRAGTDQNGVLFGGLKSQSVVIAPKYWNAGEQAVSAGAVAQIGGWHHLAYTQKDTIGTLYVDGMLVKTDTITWVPSKTLRQPGRLGTNYNWLGRSPYVGDAYLTNTLLYDFRIYDKALTEEEIQLTELNVVTMIASLDQAYLENPNTPVSVRNPLNSAVKIYGSANGIRINGLTGTEHIALFDLSGRSIRVTNPNEIILKPGLYFVKVDNMVTKVLVR